MLASLLDSPFVVFVGYGCLWLFLTIPFAWACRRMAREDAMSEFEAVLIGLAGGPLGLWVVYAANDRARKRADLIRGELEVKLLKEREEAESERAGVDAGPDAAPMEAFQVPPKLADNAPLPPEDLPASQAFRPPPPEAKGSWLTDPPSTPPQPNTSDSDPPQPVNSSAG